MPDEIDRDQDFNDERLASLIEQCRFRPSATPSRTHCRFCGNPIPAQRRQTLPGIDTCTRCQTIMEHRHCSPRR
jgi:phage/conjugal plasmid C-4 type zinc finger TraR family protein